ncbi:hypothetical protein Arad_2323 [Rhizobium rhizogenes K84]|uniref:Uncharacterized protein n=1 Tax=Rhizobium rhizogenes (strain K84 / ATCC BAA-868) TaxID=311403 RepID=B9JF53_RHIR8|nr:hypothetical protein Arad_2323 [Rhizobium rhizogenes K84]
MMPQVLDSVHEILNCGPCISAMGGKDCLDWIKFRLFGCYGGFSAHWSHVSIPPTRGCSNY